MRFACLGSGSRGNAWVVEAGRTRVLLDCGFSVRETLSRLSRLQLQASDLAAVVVSHEHSDHVGGVAALARRFGLPVWLTHGTLCGGGAQLEEGVAVHLFDCHAPFSVGDLEINPFPVPHDAREPAQFVFGDGARRLGVLTDVGCATPHIEATLKGCDALVLESNHDERMLRDGPYPRSLKARVGGRFGHLDNAAAAGLLGRLEMQRLQHVVAAHLSEKNNLPELARRAFSGAMNCDEEWVGIADQDCGIDWRQIA